MNFFESQDTAKRNTGKLIFLFALAVLSLIVITNLLLMVIFSFSGTMMTSMAATTRFHFDPMMFLVIGAIVSSIILFGSLYKISALSGGGARIAEMMNARLLVSGSSNLAERRVLNIVEEMAIASGTPVPPLYLMEESGINAFAAGYSASDAIVAVTKGSIEILSRDQLQGVIAHEFSHILHGDMRINIRLIGVLHGIMVLGIVGYHLLRGGSYSRRTRSFAGTMFLGLGLVVVGFVGTFFGN
jgi:Zn-dependent protease with chaperone function